MVKDLSKVGTCVPLKHCLFFLKLIFFTVFVHRLFLAGFAVCTLNMQKLFLYKKLFLDPVQICTLSTVAVQVLLYTGDAANFQSHPFISILFII